MAPPVKVAPKVAPKKAPAAKAPVAKKAPGVPKKAAPIAPKKAAVAPPEATPPKKKKKKKKDDTDYFSSWFSGIDTTAYIAQANEYYAAASNAVQGYVKPATVEEEEDEEEEEVVVTKATVAKTTAAPKIVPKPVPVGSPPDPTVVPKKPSGLARFFTRSSAKAPSAATVEPDPVVSVVPKKIPPRPSEARVPGTEDTPASAAPSVPIVRVPPKRPPPAKSSAEVSAATEMLLGEEDAILAHRNYVVEQQSKTFCPMPPMDNLKLPPVRRHPSVAARRSSDGDTAMGVTKLAGVDDPFDFAYQHEIDRVIASREFLDAVKRAQGSVVPSGGDPGEPIMDLSRPFSPALDNTSTVMYLPHATCLHCGFFRHSCICGVPRPQLKVANPVDAARARREMEQTSPQRRSPDLVDSPGYSDDEGEHVSVVMKSGGIQKPQTKSPDKPTVRFNS
jgi:hypothetical protein